MSDTFLKCEAVVFIGAVLVLVLKSKSAEISFLLSVCVSVTVVALTVTAVFPSVKEVLSIYEKVLSNGAVKTVIKTLIIAYVAEFCADTCRDFGQTALAAKAEFAGKCTIFILSVPLINSLIKTAAELTTL